MAYGRKVKKWILKVHKEFQLQYSTVQYSTNPASSALLFLFDLVQIKMRRSTHSKEFQLLLQTFPQLDPEVVALSISVLNLQFTQIYTDFFTLSS